MVTQITRVPPQSFAAQFRAMRENSGLSLRHVAKASGISASFLTDIEHGRRMPSRNILKKLATAINRAESELLKFDPRHSVEEVLATVATQPEIAQSLAQICRHLQSGKVALESLERFATKPD